MILNWLSRLSTLPRWLLVSGLAAMGFSVSAAREAMIQGPLRALLGSDKRLAGAHR
jgi:hypothetical protein